VIFAGIADWADSGEYGVVFMCAQLGVSTAGYYAWRGRAPSARATEDAALTAEIIAAHLALHGNPGVRRMWAHLTAVGRRISAKRVHRLMQAAGLQGRHSKQWKVTTVAGDNPSPAPETDRPELHRDRGEHQVVR
jgi:transposase InsO family protein